LPTCSSRSGGGSRRGRYAAAKAAVNQLTQSLALQYADTGVRINAVLAGLIDTPLAHGELSEGHDLESVRADRAAKSPTPWMAFGSFWSGIQLIQLQWPSGKPCGGRDTEAHRDPRL
jgi:NAD(P)-dependent dehydrogenase (short-subunit alcohol dehydrogenase family)